VPDYVTRVREGGYYGWPWYYMGNHEDPRHAGERPDLAGKAIVPDVPEQSHSASLQMTFYPGGGLRARGVSRGIPRGHLRRISRLLEPDGAHRGQGRARAA
jgi:hypothetical protein